MLLLEEKKPELPVSEAGKSLTGGVVCKVTVHPRTPLQTIDTQHTISQGHTSDVFVNSQILILLSFSDERNE